MSTATNPTSQARLDPNRVSQNHRIHGLTSSRIQIENPEEQEAFDELRALQLAEHNPQSSSEQHLFEEILHSMWILERVRIRQGQSFDAEGLDGLETEDEQLRKAYDRLERYATRAQNTWFRCRKMLKIVQNERIAVQSQEKIVPLDDLVAELKQEDQTRPAAQETAASDVPAEELSEVERKIMQMDSNDPDFVAKAERLVQENFLAGLAKLATPMC